MPFFIIFLIFFTAVLCYVFTVETNKSNYWSSKGIPNVKNKLFLGVLWDYITQNVPFGTIYENIYRKFPHAPCVGTFIANQPNLILRDPKLIQHVLRMEFQSFSSRGIETNWEVDKLADNVLFMEGMRWKLVRQKFTPVFTSGKLKNMFYIIDKTGREFEKLIDRMRPEGHHMMDIITTFATSSIGASVFGIDTRPSVDYDSPLQKMGRDASNPSFVTNLKFSLSNLTPTLFRWLKLKLFGSYEHFFIEVVKSVLRSRRQEKVKRHDFIDIALDIQKQENLEDPDSGYKVKTTDELIAAQAFFFFTAGVDPTATVIHFTLFELSKNPEILEKLLREVDAVFSEHGDEISYDSVDKMEYLDKVLNESMRMYPPITHFQRKCVMDNVLPGGMKISKGTKITIPVLAIQRDETYYPNPEIFNPENFSSIVEKERPNFTFLPFGEGNRICIGMRFARLQAKTGLLHLLRRRTVQSTVGGESWGRPKFEKTLFTLRASDLNYKLVPRF